MRIVLGADHRGYVLKNAIAEHLKTSGHDVIDVGTNGSDPVDYPDVAVDVARPILSGDADRGIVLCGSGVGAAIASNKIPGIRAGLCHDTYSAHQGVEHDDMNVICMGSRIIGDELAREIVDAFVDARFMDKERYRRRLQKIRALEQNHETVERNK
ncbi:MAG: ribose 5-phosphate isomerase B [Dehalococcoidia bacterium]